MTGRVDRPLDRAVRQMPAAYVKAHVWRLKSNAADAEAICEAVVGVIRFLPVESA